MRAEIRYYIDARKTERFKLSLLEPMSLNSFPTLSPNTVLQQSRARGPHHLLDQREEIRAKAVKGTVQTKVSGLGKAMQTEKFAAFPPRGTDW